MFLGGSQLRVTVDFVTRSTFSLVGGSGGSEREENDISAILGSMYGLWSRISKGVLTDGVSGPGGVGGDGERAESQSVLSSHSELVVQTL